MIIDGKFKKKRYELVLECICESQIFYIKPGHKYKCAECGQFIELPERNIIKFKK